MESVAVVEIRVSAKAGASMTHLPGGALLGGESKIRQGDGRHLFSI